MLLNPLNQVENPLISYEVPPQIQLLYHISILQELTQLQHLLITDLLILDLDPTRFKYSPTFYCRTKVLMHWCTLNENNFVNFLV